LLGEISIEVVVQHIGTCSYSTTCSVNLKAQNNKKKF